MVKVFVWDERLKKGLANIYGWEKFSGFSSLVNCNALGGSVNLGKSFFSLDSS